MAEPKKAAASEEIDRLADGIEIGEQELAQCKQLLKLVFRNQVLTTFGGKDDVDCDASERMSQNAALRARILHTLPSPNGAGLRDDAPWALAAMQGL